MIGASVVRRFSTENTLVLICAIDVGPVLLYVHNVWIVVGKVGGPFALVVKTAV